MELAGGTAVPGGFLVAETFQAAAAPVLQLLSRASSVAGADPALHVSPLLHPSISLVWTQFLCSWRSLLLPARTPGVV